MRCAAIRLGEVRRVNRDGTGPLVSHRDCRDVGVRLVANEGYVVSLCRHTQVSMTRSGPFPLSRRARRI